MFSYPGCLLHKHENNPQKLIEQKTMAGLWDQLALKLCVKIVMMICCSMLGGELFTCIQERADNAFNERGKIHSV